MLGKHTIFPIFGAFGVEVRPIADYLSPGSGANFWFFFYVIAAFLFESVNFRLIFRAFLERQSAPALSKWDCEATRNLTFLAGFLLWKLKCSTIFRSTSQPVVRCYGVADAARRREFWCFCGISLPKYKIYIIFEAFSERQFATGEQLTPRNGLKLGISD